MPLRFHSLRSQLLVKLDQRIPNNTGLYTAYELPESEYVGILEMPSTQVANKLEELGYEYNYLSAAKVRPSTGGIEVGSYRRVPSRHPSLPNEEQPRIMQEWEPAQCQFHVHLFKDEHGTALFSHYELRPDFLEPSVSPKRLDTHYKPEWDEEYLQGVVDPVLNDFLEDRL